MAPLNWSRMMNPSHPLRGIVAVDAHDAAQGFVCFLALAFTWSTGDVCYLQDLFVRRACRGLGYGRLLIERLVEIAREQGWSKIFWMTETDNHVARRLYAKVAKQMDFVRYDLVVCPP